MKRSSLMKEEDIQASSSSEEKVRKEFMRACGLAKQLEEQVKGPWIYDHHFRLDLSRKALDAAATFHNAAMLLHSGIKTSPTHAQQSTKNTPSSSPSTSDNMSDQGINSPKTSNPYDQDHSTSFQNLRKRKLMPKFTVRTPCISVDSGYEMPPDDGHVWRKYGQKDILGSRHPRCYYRCTHKNDTGCTAVKHVQRSDDDPNFFNVTYQGCHNCTPSSQSQNPLDFLPFAFPLAQQSPSPPFSAALDFDAEFQLDFHPAPMPAPTAPLIFTTTGGGIFHLTDADSFSSPHLRLPFTAPPIPTPLLSSDTLLDSTSMASFTSSTIATDPTQELITENLEDPWQDSSIYHELEKQLALIDNYGMYEHVGCKISSSLSQTAADIHPQLVERPPKQQPSASEAEAMNAIGYPNSSEPFFLLFPDDNLA